MTETEENEAPKPSPTRKRKHRPGAGLTATLALAFFVLTISALVISGRPVPLPAALGETLYGAINARLAAVQISAERVSFSVASGLRPKLTIEGVGVFGHQGERLADLNRIEAIVATGAALQGRLNLEEISLRGAQITVRRNASGQFTIRNDQASGEETPLSVAAVLGTLDNAFDNGPISAIREVLAENVVISLEDARSGRVWQATNAQLVLRERSDGVTVSVASDLFNGTDDLAQVQLSLAFDDTTWETELGVRLENVPSNDIALQSPALAWLSVLRSPISGAMRAQLSGNGTLESLNGTLDLEDGVLQPEGLVEPIRFQTARAYFSFDPDRQRLDFDEIGFQSSDFRVTAAGHSYLSGTPDDWAASFVSQFDVTEAIVHTDELFGAPVSIDRAQADLRLKLSPFRLEVANAFAQKEEVAARAVAEITVEEGLWNVDVDASTDTIHGGRVLEFWPTLVAPKTRKWLTERVIDGTLSDVSFGVRFVQGTKPEVSLSFDYHDAIVRYLDDMPVAQDGAGRATIHNREFVIEIEKGWVPSGEGKRVNGAGSVFRVSDIRQKPPQGALSIVARGQLESVLSVIDHPPLQLMERAGRTTDFATAETRVKADISMPLKDGLEFEDVDFDVLATARLVESSEIVPGRRLESEELQLVANPDELQIRGDGALDGVPFDAEWRAGLGQSAVGTSSATGDVALSEQTLSAFGVDLPPQTLRGEGTASYELAIGPDDAATLKLSSDLRGLGISIPALGWNKSPSASGGLDFSMELGGAPDVRQLDFSAPGLAFSGDVDFGESGQLAQLRLDRLRVGQWLDATARIRPRPGGAPNISLVGGQMDLRALPSAPEGQTKPRSDGAPLSIDLDRVVVTDQISMSPFRGEVRPSLGGLDGDFEGRLSGSTLVRGSLVPAFGSTAVRVESDDAGGVLRDSGITRSGRGGEFYLVMSPVNGAPAGTYDGEFRINKMRLQDAPVLAGLLNAMSIVGLLDQLSGGGLGFDTIDGAFRMTPDRIVLQRFAAVGPSLGISADGVYDPVDGELDMQGVVSPIYFVNGIGSLLTRRGEGLFGFSYRLSGPTSAPTVSVNPLSILTPGMFREIFRQPVPVE